MNLKSRVPAVPQPSTASVLKRRWVNAGRPGSLKSFLHELAQKDDEARVLMRTWHDNKTLNFSKPPQGIGHTNGKRGKKSKNTAEPKKEKK